MVNTKPVKKSAYDTKWGIFDSSLKVVFDVDTCVDVDFKSSSKVSHFPVERSGFVDYDKVREPFTVKLRMAVGGDSKRMAAFLVALELAKNSTDLYWVVTPEATYKDVNLVDYSYKRAADKECDMISAVVSLIEIRQIDVQYTTTVVKLPAGKVKSPSAASKKDAGNKQESDLSKLRARHINPRNAIAEYYGDAGKPVPSYLPDVLRGKTASTPGGLSGIGR